MRALGPGSVSSFVKIILDVVFVVLWVGVVASGLMALAAMLFALNPELLSRVSMRIEGLDPASVGPVMAAGLFVAGLYLCGVLAIVGSLRHISRTLTLGDPFHPDNVRRLRLIGLILALLEIGRHLVWAGAVWMLPEVERQAPGFNPTAWFSVLVVFVLAEVFREGARLRREAELTI